ncbi:hypothetical protein CDAR_609561 [Caerostris darwini]|uniref:Uncharacterized protein n=1 Tax=Caerostris darwini TaxID=1538125 RepID=A0AAV4SCC9_9ARAC|nr:hypothetical protein CDAR_609561 [Caerostris darwini]
MPVLGEFYSPICSKAVPPLEVTNGAAYSATKENRLRRAWGKKSIVSGRKPTVLFFSPFYTLPLHFGATAKLVKHSPSTLLAEYLVQIIYLPHICMERNPPNMADVLRIANGE